MIRVCLDTNVIVSGLISHSGAPYEVLEAWRGREFILLTSDEIVTEVSKVLQYPKIRNAFSLTDEEIEKSLLLLSKYSQRTPGELRLDVITEDPSDNMLLACAVEGNADFIVSGDNHLLNIETYQGIQILSPREFIRQLES
ncbi:MAG: putative toxin-antitoxin system toxin component, PIN family [Methanolobus sp.]|uniref:putative toxin-antitoxin system toxin component, PIN family n=1 Tax=Methanolobus sp. TaxID=1874737 RepID=UPI00272F5B30|nr:putative toxin-antitoxin system toxin component, PIN family [Methanolobus sp.]MDP2216201.1 putative toxin-antitoxin system toxin component, PIN family [Methanolobus sp.]